MPLCARRIFISAPTALLAVLVGGFSSRPFAMERVPSASSSSQIILEAKATLRRGVNGRDSAACRAARDLFLRALLEAKEGHAWLEYHIALADYRLATFAFISKDAAEAGRAVAEAKGYLEKSMTADPSSGEFQALFGYLLGLEIALHPDLAMTLAAPCAQAFAQAEAKEPSSPRVHLLRGAYWLYVPAAFGGGPDAALPSLEKAAALFDQEDVADPLKPDWGEDESFLYLGLAYKAKKDPAKARAMFEKTLALNPDFGWARSELAALDKK